MNCRRLVHILVTAGVVVLFVLPVGGIRLWRWYEKKRLLEADHRAILAACRQLIKDRDDYRAYAWKLPYYSPATNAYALNAQDILTNSSVPRVIRELRPKDLIIYEDHVIMSTQAPRVGLIAWAEGSKQFGTTELIDGLWYWEGRRSDRKYGEPAGE